LRRGAAAHEKFTDMLAVEDDKMNVDLSITAWWFGWRIIALSSEGVKGASTMLSRRVAWARSHIALRAA